MRCYSIFIYLCIFIYINILCAIHFMYILQFLNKGDHLTSYHSDLIFSFQTGMLWPD